MTTDKHYLFIILSHLIWVDLTGLQYMYKMVSSITFTVFECLHHFKRLLIMPNERLLQSCTRTIRYIISIQRLAATSVYTFWRRWTRENYSKICCKCLIHMIPRKMKNLLRSILKIYNLLVWKKNFVLIVKLTQNMNLKVTVGFDKNVSKIFHQIVIRVLIVMIVMIVSSNI